ncbi:MAG: hypothetical protein P1P64_03220 [Treponemataceae bacterium]
MAIIYATILVGADRRSFEYADRFQIYEVDARSKTKMPVYLKAGTPKSLFTQP